MALNYETTNWENGKTVLKAEHLRKIEKGITDIIAENDAIYTGEDIRKSNEEKRQEEHSRKMNEVSEVVSDIQKDYDSLQKIIIDENASANLQNQINQTNSQLEQKTSLTNTKVEVINNEPIGGNIVHIYGAEKCDARILELHNRTGIKADGSNTGIVNARESLVIHHYNDNNNIQVDNVGRDNVMVVLKQSANKTMASHEEVGRGDFINFDRNGKDLPTPLVVEHLGRVGCEDWWDVGMLAPEHSWGMTIEGKHYNGQTLLPPLVYTRGKNSNSKGSDALRIHSLAYGGAGLRIVNDKNSFGELLKLDSYTTQPGYPALSIKQSGKNSALAIYNNGQLAPMISFQRSNAYFGDLIIARNENNEVLFRVEGDGLAIHLKDSATGELKRLAISNGEVVIQ